jgi:hypothetical protein
MLLFSDEKATSEIEKVSDVRLVDESLRTVSLQSETPIIHSFPLKRLEFLYIIQTA